MGNHRGARGRFHDDQHPAEQRTGRLLGKAPRREVERVDQEGDALPRGAHVSTDEARRASDLNRLAVVQVAAVAQGGA